MLPRLLPKKSSIEPSPKFKERQKVAVEAQTNHFCEDRNVTVRKVTKFCKRRTAKLDLNRRQARRLITKIGQHNAERRIR